MKVGDVVKIKASFMGEPAGVLAYVYDEYRIDKDPGLSLITQNGTDVGGFSKPEQDMYLEFHHHSGFKYHFENVIKLSQDWDRGVFRGLFGGDEQSSEERVKIACTKGHEKSCFYAKSDSCECDCNGENHGRAYAEKH